MNGVYSVAGVQVVQLVLFIELLCTAVTSAGFSGGSLFKKAELQKELVLTMQSAGHPHGVPVRTRAAACVNRHLLHEGCAPLCTVAPLQAPQPWHP
jgi:hypothetical protein